MTHPVFSEAVAGFGEPFPDQAGPFVTRPTAPYEHSTSSYLAANGFGNVDLDQDPFISVYMKPAGFLAITGAGAAAGAFLAFRKTRSYGWAAGGAAIGSFTPVVAALTYELAFDSLSIGFLADLLNAVFTPTTMSSRANKVRVFDAEKEARSITETFKDRNVEYEETLEFDWPDVVQQIGDSLGVAYASDKWKPKDARGKREWEVYKHIAESRNRIFSVPGIIRHERRRDKKLETIGPLLSLKKSSRDGSLLMPSHVSILGIFKEANVELHTGGTNDEPEFGEGDDGVTTLSVKHGMLGASKMKLMGKLVPFLFVYTPDDGVYFIIIGDELDIEKDGIVG